MKRLAALAVIAGLSMAVGACGDKTKTVTIPEGSQQPKTITVQPNPDQQRPSIPERGQQPRPLGGQHPQP